MERLFYREGSETPLAMDAISGGLFEFVDFGSGQKEAAGPVVVEVGLGIIGHGLTVFWLFAGALHIAEVAVGVNCALRRLYPK